MLERTVEGSLGFCRETAGRKLSAGQVVRQALAAIALSRAGFIGAVAVSFVAVLFAFHAVSL
jgi:hypothetical protein